VNEQYALIIVPFALIEAYRVGGAWKTIRRLLWIIPLTFAVMHVPIDHFFWLAYHTILGHAADAVATTGLTGFESSFIPWKQTALDPIAVIVLGLAFWLLCLVAMVWPLPRDGLPKPGAAEGFDAAAETDEGADALAGQVVLSRPTLLLDGNGK
jgi:hypothetical protein